MLTKGSASGLELIKTPAIGAFISCMADCVTIPVPWKRWRHCDRCGLYSLSLDCHRYANGLITTADLEFSNSGLFDQLDQFLYFAQIIFASFFLLFRDGLPLIVSLRQGKRQREVIARCAQAGVTDGHIIKYGDDGTPPEHG